MIPRRQAWIAYLLMVCQGYVFYGVGYLTPYVETKLGAPAWASALPSSVMAVGLLAASVVVPIVVHRLGPWHAVRLWCLVMGGSSLLMAFGGSLLPILVGALAAGLSTAGALTHVVTLFAGRQNGVLLMRATLASVVGGVVGPLVLSAAARTIGWNLGILAPVPLAILLAALAPVALDAAVGDSSAADPAAATRAPDPAAAAGAPRRAARPTEPGLGRAYWLAWTFLVLCIGAESSFVTWGAQVAVERTGMALADATALGSLFVLGEIIGRIVLGAGGGFAFDPKRALLAMTLAGVAGGILVWLGSTAWLAGAGLLLGGLALAGVWPVTAGIAVANAPRSPVAAGARLNLASGVAVLTVPLLLGVVASLAGVLGAWGIVIGLLVVAIVVLRVVPAHA